ncbi:MAG: alpha/beta fold hydrolase [Oscillospiraceae bacterium]|nr:alpha/beta fold hydrolase [Oscillospiraceae bacterium]
MGIILFILLAAAEIGLALWSRKRARGTQAWRKGRLAVRGAELAVVLIALLLPFGQKWRLVPALIFLAVLLAIAALRWLLGRKKEDAEKKTGPVAANCVLSILFLTLLLVPAFLFTGYDGLPVTGPHPIAQASAILIDRSRTDPFEQDGSFREVPVHFYFPGDADGSERYPLVVFSHGAFGYYESNTSTYMELASHGYVVAALDHPHHAFFARDSAGELVLFDQGFFRDASTTGDSNEDPEKYYALFTSWMDLRTGDMDCAVDALKAAAGSGRLDDAWALTDSDADTILAILGCTDVTRIGLIGHSMGGATSVALGRERSDISAVVDLDGTMLGEYTGVEDGALTVRDDPYPLPVLDFDNWESYNDRKEYLAQGYRYPNNVLRENAAAAVYSVTVRDTRHMDFTDLPLLSPALANSFGSGERDKAETMTIVNGLVLGFFDHYLKGEGVFEVREIY